MRGQKTGGRKKGTPNRTRTVRTVLRREGLEPVLALAAVARGDAAALARMRIPWDGEITAEARLWALGHLARLVEAERQGGT